MSAATARSIGDTALDAAVAVAWAQWAALTRTASAETEARSIVDPEALMLASLAVSDREPRLTDLLAAMAGEASHLLSVQRMVSLGKRFPEDVRHELRAIAQWALEAGDARWKRLAGGATLPKSRGKRLGALGLARPSALMLRLRAGFGVGAKADVLAMLLGLHGTSARVAEIAAGTGYSTRAVRDAAEEMAIARLIHALPGAPAAYRADPTAWTPLLRGDSPRAESLGTWRYWAIVLPFLLDVGAWAEAAEREGWSPYVASSRARDLVERHGPRLRHTGWPVPHDPDAHGEWYLQAFGRIVSFSAQQAIEDLGD